MDTSVLSTLINGVFRSIRSTADDVDAVLAVLGDLQKAAESSTLSDRDWHIVVGGTSRQNHSPNLPLRHVVMTLLQVTLQIVVDCGI